MKVENTNVAFGARFKAPSRRVVRILQKNKDFDMNQFLRDIPKIKKMTDDTVTFTLDARNLYAPDRKGTVQMLIATKRLGLFKKASKGIFLFGNDTEYNTRELLPRLYDEVKRIQMPKLLKKADAIAEAEKKAEVRAYERAEKRACEIARFKRICY